MNSIKANPFNLTKAEDLTDPQINSYWVDLPHGGFAAIARGSSPMPMFIVGGKGSGKTHLMRYMSLPLQKLRGGQGILDTIQAEGYLGIYSRCSGLNSGRFDGKSQTTDLWRAVFAYYMDLWLAEHVLAVIYDLCQTAPANDWRLDDIGQAVINLFDRPPFTGPLSFADLLKAFAALRHEIDFQVNNSALTEQLDISILSSPGRLVFEIPILVAERAAPLQNVTFLHLIDEFENLTGDQQRYVNSLVRERKAPSSLRIGARTYGIRTRLTYGGGEELRQGAEYDWLALDARLREHGRAYKNFARNLCARRLQQAGYLREPGHLTPPSRALDRYFEEELANHFAQKETAFVLTKYASRERPYFSALREKLRTFGDSFPSRAGDIDELIANLTIPPFPLLEKINVFLLYQDWYSGRNLPRSAASIGQLCASFQVDPRARSRYSTIYKHWHDDMLAQLYRQCDVKQRYIGLGTIVEMSHGIPRNILVALKNIFNVAVFRRESPFSGGIISTSAQQEGILEVADWFYKDARAPGIQGVAARDAIDRLAAFFRACRFTDKPVEVSLASFSTDMSQISESARELIETAERWSLLVSVPGGQRDRNSSRVDAKYQLNKIMSPRWDLPVARRGTVALSADEVNAIFSPASEDEYAAIVEQRVSRMTAPWFGGNRKPSPGRPATRDIFSD